MLAAMHRASAPDGGPLDPWFQEPVGARRWDDLVERLRAAGAPFAERLAELRDELVGLEAWLEPPSRLITCHRDLWADNLLPTAGGGRVRDRLGREAVPPTRATELGYVLFEFARSDGGPGPSADRGLRRAGGPATVGDRGDFSMLIAVLGHITEIAANDWLRAERALSRAGRRGRLGSARSSTSRTPERSSTRCSTRSRPSD